MSRATTSPLGVIKTQPDAVDLENLLIDGASHSKYLQDDLPTLGSGTFAGSDDVKLSTFGFVGQLARLRIRFDFSFAAGESAVIRVYRYRTFQGVFLGYCQITDSVTLTDADQFSETDDFSSAIRPGMFLSPAVDSLATSIVYTAGGTPTMRALRIDHWLSIASIEIPTQLPPVDTQVRTVMSAGVNQWPPTLTDD